MDKQDFETQHTFRDELAARVSETPDKVFMWFDDIPVTFADAQRSARSAANQLLSLGVEPGDTVAILTLNCAEWLATWLGAAEIGAISMPINIMFRGEFLRHQLADSAAKVLVVDAMFLPQVAEVAGQLDDLETVLVRGEADIDEAALEGIAVRDVGMLSEGATDAVRGGHPHAWNEPACLFYTSGTTGPSKGALITQQYLCVAAKALGEAYGLTPDDVTYAAVPLFHMGGAYGVVSSSLVSGRTAVLDSAFSVTACWDRVREHDASVFLGVGPMIMMLMSVPPDPRDKDLPLRMIAGAPVPPGMHEQVEERFGCVVAQAYGQTEVIPVALYQADQDIAPGSAGKLGPLHDVRIVDDDDIEVETGAVGEITVRPRYPHVMFEGYRNQPARTLEQMRNLWFHTGDMGRIDEQGNLWWVDRKKDSIRRRGENISSFEVEQAVMSHAGVLEVAAHAVPSDIGEEDVKVCVVAAPDAAPSPQALIEHCVEVMPSFMVPRYIEIVDALPKNVIGRVQKHVLRETPLTDATWDREAAEKDLVSR